MPSSPSSSAAAVETFPKDFDVSNTSKYNKADIQQALRDDGAVILSNLVGVVTSNDDDDESSNKEQQCNWQQVASDVPLLVFDQEQLLLGRNHRADPVHVEHEQIGLSGAALAPHSDGYIWGDHYPDLVLLICERPAAAVNATDAASSSTINTGGGANFLIDGLNVVNRLQPTTRKLLESTLVDHTERLESGSFVQGAESIVPVIRWLKKHDNDPSDAGGNEQRLCWRRMVGDAKKQNKKKKENQSTVNEDNDDETYLSLWAPVNDNDDTMKIEIKRSLREVDKAIEEESKVVPRFRLKRGQAMIVDNFRMLHAREAFKGSESRRRMWRVWSWTTNSFGLPPQLTSTGGSGEGTMASASDQQTDSTKAVTKIAANILEAQQVIQG